jgi:predicted Fe-Mo cluster-binding NifX family protein
MEPLHHELYRFFLHFFQGHSVFLLKESRMGPRAIEFFDGCGVEAVTGASEKIEEVLNAKSGSTLKI